MTTINKCVVTFEPIISPIARDPVPFVGMQACGDVMIMIAQHGRSVHELYPHILWGKGDSHFSSCIIIT